MSFFSASELKDLYYRNLRSHLKVIELERIKIFRVGTFMILTGIITFLLVQFKFNFPTDGLLFVTIPIFGISLIYSFFLYSKFRKQYKHKIVQEVMTLVDPSWKYAFDGRVPDSCFLNSKIFDRSDVDRVSGDDYIYGAWKGVPFQLSELHLQKETRDSKGRRRYSTIFHGLFCEIRFNKKIHGDTFIYPDQTEKFLGKFLGDFIQGLSTSRGQQVKLENPDFEKNFNCYSHDQVEARYIITPLLMEKILSLKDKLSCNLYFSFVGESVFVGLAFNRTLFEPRIFRSLHTFDALKELYLELTSICMIIEELKLNENLWGKK
jgi:hypothetical protein